jgi:hypothetical protein
MMKSIAAFLQPHTSSPSLFAIARAMASLMATNFSDSDLNLVLAVHLDSLAISPQAQQAIIPALLGMAKFTEVQAQVQRCALFSPLMHSHQLSPSALLSHKL